MVIRRKHIKSLSIKGYSGVKPRHTKIAIPKIHQYYVVTDIAITGDAPKDFIRYYHFGEGRGVKISGILLKSFVHALLLK